MMETQDRAAELRGRIGDSVRVYGEPLPREMAVAWHGYLAAALEWGLLSAAQHGELSGLLPAPPGDFIAHVFLGAEEGDAAGASPVAGDW
jgi:hypothetical protein